MLLQTNSYIVPREKRSEHARLLRKFRQTLARLGCDHFEVYEQVGSNWSSGETTGRFVQIMRFRDRRHQQAVQAAERSDPVAQALIQEFCELINFPYQQQQGLFAVGFYTSALPIASPRARHAGGPSAAAAAGEEGAEAPEEAEEEELVVEAHEAEPAVSSVAPPTPTSPSEDDSSLGNLSADVEQSELEEEQPQPPEETDVEPQPPGEGFVSEELTLTQSPDDAEPLPEERDDLPESLDLDDLAELSGEEHPRTNDQSRPA